MSLGCQRILAIVEPTLGNREACGSLVRTAQGHASPPLAVVPSSMLYRSLGVNIRYKDKPQTLLRTQLGAPQATACIKSLLSWKKSQRNIAS
jgi:hypothetical protein